MHLRFPKNWISQTVWGMTVFVLVGFSGVVSLLAQDSFFKPTRETLTLKTSLERAARNNPRLLELGKELSIAKANSREAASLFYPKVNVNLNYTRFRNETLGL